MSILLTPLMPAAAGDSKPGAKPSSIQVAPGVFELSGHWASQRILVTGVYAGGEMRDVTSITGFRSSNAKVVKVSAAGVVTPVADGVTTIQIAVKGMGSRGKRKLPVTVKGFAGRQVSFLNQIEPALGALGCNSAQCHGSQRGKGGLRLSLFCSDPQADYDALARAAGGRRINRNEPTESLLLLKPSGLLDHSGGVKAPPGSPAYDMLLSWVRGGANPDDKTVPELAELRLYPDERQMEKGQAQHLLVTAVFSNGSQKDVTSEATFSTSNPKVGTVSAEVLNAADPGVAAVVATYLGRSAVLRVSVPQHTAARFPPLQTNNPIDQLVYQQLKLLGIPPSPAASDSEFLRRVYLDSIGLLPTPDQARAFLTSTDPNKRAALIDDLLQREEYNDFWSLKWGDLLRIKSEFPVRLWPKAVAVYYDWLHQSLAANTPYDQFARELLTATGSNFRNGPANFVRAVSSKDPRTLAETAALVFMGARVGCARCHAHPQENWKPTDNLALGAFFARVNYKSSLEWKEEIVYPDFKLNLRNPLTRQVVEPRLPGGKPITVGPEEDPRGQFADWLIAPDNPWFARNAVNRIWFWLMGRGIVNEPDDMRATNPPVNPELLAYLEKELVSNAYDLRHIYRLILNSQTYQRDSTPNEWNARDSSLFSHYIPKRLTAEQLLDAISQFTQTSEKFRSIIPEPFSNWPGNYRATQISDGNTECNFLDLFGRPPRDTPYEEERDSDLTLRQTLYLLNSDQLEAKLSTSPRLKLLVSKTDPEIVEDLYLATLSRFPTEPERRKMLDYLARKKTARAQAIQDAAWAVLNTKEFVFNH